MRFRLRTLLIVMALGPPVLAGAWFFSSKVNQRRSQSGALSEAELVELRRMIEEGQQYKNEANRKLMSEGEWIPVRLPASQE